MIDSQEKSEKWKTFTAINNMMIMDMGITTRRFQRKRKVVWKSIKFLLIDNFIKY